MECNLSITLIWFKTSSEWNNFISIYVRFSFDQNISELTTAAEQARNVNELVSSFKFQVY